MIVSIATRSPSRRRRSRPASPKLSPGSGATRRSCRRRFRPSSGLSRRACSARDGWTCSLERCLFLAVFLAFAVGRPFLSSHICRCPYSSSTTSRRICPSGRAHFQHSRRPRPRSAPCRSAARAATSRLLALVSGARARRGGGVSWAAARRAPGRAGLLI